MSNDFGKPQIPPYARTRQPIEGRETLSIFAMTKAGIFRERRKEAEQLFYSGGIRLKLVHCPSALDWYIEIVNYGPKNRCSTIDLVETKCNYGGKRQWFLCPRCQGRCGILYREVDDYWCRECLNLEYSSHRINYKSIEPFVRDMSKLMEINRYETIPKRSFHKGKMTKKAEHYEKLRERVERGSKIISSLY